MYGPVDGVWVSDLKLPYCSFWNHHFFIKKIIGLKS